MPRPRDLKSGSSLRRAGDVVLRGLPLTDAAGPRRGAWPCGSRGPRVCTRLCLDHRATGPARQARVRSRVDSRAAAAWGAGRKQGSIARFRDMTRSPRGLRAGRVKTLGCREGGCGVPVRPESPPRRNPSATGAVASPAADARHGGGRRVPLRADTFWPPTPSGGVGGGDPVTHPWPAPLNAGRVPSDPRMNLVSSCFYLQSRGTPCTLSLKQSSRKNTRVRVWQARPPARPGLLLAVEHQVNGRPL